MKGKNFSTNNSSGKRKKSDFYETPYSLTRLLLEKEKLEGTVLEPACGELAIVKVLKENGYQVDFSDLDNGIDECQEIEITKDELKDLYHTLQAVKTDHSKAEELLPCQSGFFFGLYNYDEWYFEDVDDAIELFEKIDKVMQENKGKYDLVYQASW